MKNFVLLLTFFFTSLTDLVFAQEDLTYQVPPKEIVELVNAPQTPLVILSPDKEWILLVDRSDYPGIEQLAQPELRLAGLRINPKTNNRSRTIGGIGMKLKNINSKLETSLKGMPSSVWIEYVQWSPDSKFFAFTLTQPNGLELWIADLGQMQVRKMTGAVLNGTLGIPYFWLPDSRTLLARFIPEKRGEVPVKTLTPAGPVVQENTGKKAPARTYQDLLKNKYDELLFEYYANSQMTLISTDGKQKALGKPGIFEKISSSPDGKYLLTISIQKPYSYLVPANFFPQSIQILDRDGVQVKLIADLPLAEDIPKGFDAVRTGPRSVEWRSDQASTLCWVEAQDKGDPAVQTEVRDKLFALTAPFQSDKKELMAFKFRHRRIIWGDENNAIVYDGWWQNRKERIIYFSPEGLKSKVWFDRSTEDRYTDPGDFETCLNPAGKSVLLIGKNKKTLYLSGLGASPEGNRPFVDELDIVTQKTARLWRSEAPYYEVPISLLDMEKKLMLIRRESKNEAPNYFLRDMGKKPAQALTNFSHLYPLLTGIEKQLIKFKRKDGVDLQGDLYLPKNFKTGDQPLPVLMWAYPFEFKSAEAAGQVQGSPYQFIRLNWGSPIYWVTQGYAVFDNVSMPVVGEGNKEPNDSFVQQITWNAEAAIEQLVKMGVGDRNRVAVGGHSYGAFMTANLMAHCDLFAAGIARSGAYNRTLTPFGFQSEERTYWEASQVYNVMSPFQNADKINKPLLLIHGEADNNSGTFPIQTERLYNALKGLGKTSRFVLLPHESHGYAAKESILHTLWEQHQWLEKYVKNKKIATGSSGNPER